MTANNDRRLRPLATLLVLLFAAGGLRAAEIASGESAADAGAAEAEGAAEVVHTPNAPKALSGMSILGNSEAPKSLVIVPWKTSEIGDGIGVSNLLDGRARPVDRDVFMRELDYYRLRTGARDARHDVSASGVSHGSR